MVSVGWSRADGGDAASGSLPAFDKPRHCPAVASAEMGAHGHVPLMGAAHGLSTAGFAVSLCSWQMGAGCSWPCSTAWHLLALLTPSSSGLR